MSWSASYKVRGHTIEVDSGFGFSAGPRLSLDAFIIYDMSDEDIVEVARWFYEHSAEIYAIHTGAECCYDAQFISDQQLEMIINSNLTSERDRKRAINELNYRLNSGPYRSYEMTSHKAAKKIKTKKPGYIYLAYSETDHYKIGKSLGPEDRIAVFDTQMPVEVSMVHIFEADDMSGAEAELHNDFSYKRVKGEWFDLDEFEVELITSITGYSDGKFYHAGETIPQSS